jgi:hypothetical protein
VTAPYFGVGISLIEKSRSVACTWIQPVEKTVSQTLVLFYPYNLIITHPVIYLSDSSTHILYTINGQPWK